MLKNTSNVKLKKENNTFEVIYMKKKLILLALLLAIGLSVVLVGNNIDKSIKKIPESAVLL